MSFNPTPFELFPALWYWLGIVGALLTIVMFAVALPAVIVGGPNGRLAALAGIVRQIADGFVDLAKTSPRRVWAVALLTIREAIRRKALLVFVLFAILFMFGGMFIGNPTARADLQVKVYVSFVLTAISWLILPVVLLLSCWGIPEDIRLRSLHTVVTKPIHRNEVVLGRILGFASVGTLILAIMGVVGYFWLLRSVPDVAQESLICRVPTYGELRFIDRFGSPTTSGVNTGDIWEFRSFVEGATRSRAIWEFQGIGPEDMIDVQTEDDPPDKTSKRLRFESRFEAFRTHKGEIERRLFAEMACANLARSDASLAVSQAAGFGGLAINISNGDFEKAGKTLFSLSSAIGAGHLKPSSEDYAVIATGFGKLAGILESLRAAAGKNAGWIDDVTGSARACASAGAANSAQNLASALGQLSEAFQNHQAELSSRLVDLRARLPVFEVAEFDFNIIYVGRELRVAEEGGAASRSVDLFNDLVRDGVLQVEVRCIDPGQYLGMARPDLFIRAPDKPFASGYFKSIAATWMLMLMVVVIGVTTSCFVKGPVSTFLTLVILLVGIGMKEFLASLISVDHKGGGPLESIIRIARHMNPMQELEDSPLVTVVQFLDGLALMGLNAVQHIIPDFSIYHTAPWVSSGFDVDWRAGLLPCLALTVGYTLPCMVLGYYSLKLRELEAK